MLVVEGSIPNEQIKSEGYWAGFGNRTRGASSFGDQPMTTNEWIDRLAPKAGDRRQGAGVARHASAGPGNYTWVMSPRRFDGKNFLALDTGGGPLARLWTTALAGLVDIGYVKSTGQSVQINLPKTALEPPVTLEWKIPRWSNAIERDRARSYCTCGSGRCRGRERGARVLVRRRRGRDTARGRTAADRATDRDAERLARATPMVRQITTGTVCHLDAEMVHAALEPWDLTAIDVLFIENVGNLVCPASYDLGEDLRAVLLSVTEGEDKPIEYPTIFNSADLAVVTKVDLAEATGLDRAELLRNIEAVRPGLPVIEAVGAGRRRERLNRASHHRSRNISRAGATGVGTPRAYSAVARPMTGGDRLQRGVRRWLSRPFCS